MDELPAPALPASQRRQFHIDSIPARPWRWRRIFVPLGLLAACCVAAVWLIERAGVPPRLLAPHLERRSSGHDPLIVGAGKQLADGLMARDRGIASMRRISTESLARLRIGAQPAPALGPLPAGSRQINVASPVQAVAALAQAQPGDVITFLPGKYRFDGAYLKADRPGTAARPVTVRALTPGTVQLAFSLVEGFLVTAPYWRFENLGIVGACAEHSTCEHAFHVVGKAHHFVARNNTIIDFNSHFKANGQGDVWPDDGLLEANTLTNSSVRHTTNPVDVIDIVGASRWIVRKNFITDFFKGEGNRTSYGGFAKGAGSANVFDNNVVLCEYRVHALGSITVGLSLGGGGTGAPFCRDGRCIAEQDGSTIRGNFIAACADDGIYLNKATGSKVIHNTLIDTAGISVRFPSSSANVEGNLVDGKIRMRDNAALHSTDNIDTSITRLFVGSHPIRALFDVVDVPAFERAIPRRSVGTGDAAPDLCGTPQEGSNAYGAFRRFADCMR